MQRPAEEGDQVRRLYRVLAFGIAVLVLLEIALVGAAAFLPVVVDKEMIDAHRMVGAYVLPVAGLALFLVSFETERKGATRFALAIWLAISFDVAVALLARGGGVAIVLHGVLALVLLLLSVRAARRLPGAAADEKWDIDDAW